MFLEGFRLRAQILLEVSQLTLKLSARQLGCADAPLLSIMTQNVQLQFSGGDLNLMWFSKGVKGLQGEAGDALHFQTGIYTPLIFSVTAKAKWHDTNVVMKAAANSLHSCSSLAPVEEWMDSWHSLGHEER